MQATYLLSYFMGCVALVRCVLVLRCSVAGVVCYPYAGDLFVELFHGLLCSGSKCVGVTLWFGCGGVVSVCRLKSDTDAIYLVYSYAVAVYCDGVFIAVENKGI